MTRRLVAHARVDLRIGRAVQTALGVKAVTSLMRLICPKTAETSVFSRLGRLERDLQPMWTINQEV
jgi:hypothetical protein